MNQSQEPVYKQFPVRLELHMADELERISKQTKINKTTLSRIAIKQFMDRLDSSGISSALEKVCAI